MFIFINMAGVYWLMVRFVCALYLTGEHPRMGALDVCPFIPVQDVTMEECIQCANQFAAGLAATLNVPGMSHF